MKLTSVTCSKVEDRQIKGIKRMAKQAKRPTRKQKIALIKHFGPGWQDRIKGQELARALEKIEIPGIRKKRRLMHVCL